MTPEELWFYTLCNKNDIHITDIQLRLLSSFKNYLLEWNKKINLVSRKNEENIWRDHIALSLALLFKIEFTAGMKILDLGTGGGFPGIPLAIMLPHCSFMLLDSIHKKINAVQAIVTSLSLPNVRTVCGRAEDLHQKTEFRNTFDLIIARAVSNLSNLLEWSLPFLKIESKFSYPKTDSERIRINLPSLVTFKGGEMVEEQTLAKIKFPIVKLQTIPLIFNGSEEFNNQEKKLIIANI